MAIGADADAAAVMIRGVHKIYPAQGGGAAKTALRGVDLSVPVGSIFGLLGPNGAGKSTLINILAGLVIKTRGVVRIWGFDQDQNPRMSRASLGVAPQELSIDPFLTPAESLEIHAGMYGVRAKHRRTAELLEALGLADKANAYSRTLSGGMRRRLLVAKALVHSPPVLILDEPTAGVDLELRRSLWSYVAELNARGVTVILTTHYLEEAEKMCDRIAILRDGLVAAEAATPDLLASLDRKTLVTRLDAAIEPAAARRLAPEGVTVESRGDRLLAFSFAPKTTPAQAILTSLSQSGVGVADLSVEEPTLEEVFVALTTGGVGAHNGGDQGEETGEETGA